MKDHSTKAAAVKAMKVSRVMGRTAPRVGRAGHGRPRRRARPGRLPSRPAGRGSGGRPAGRCRTGRRRGAGCRPASSTPLTAATQETVRSKDSPAARTPPGDARPRCRPWGRASRAKATGMTSSTWSSSASPGGGQQLLLEVELLGHPALGHDDEAAEGDQPGQRPAVVGRGPSTSSSSRSAAPS